MADSVTPGNRLRRFIRLEAQVSFLVLFGALLVSKAVITEHQVVMSLHILRIDCQNALEFLDRVRIFLLEKQNATRIIAHDAILGILRDDLTQMRKRLVISAFRSKHS